MRWFTGLRRFHRGFWRFWSKIGPFTDVYGISPRFWGSFDRKIGVFDVYGISPRFLDHFQKISIPIFVIFLVQMRFAGKITFPPRPCFRVSTFQIPLHFNVYVISPGFSVYFYNAVAPISPCLLEKMHLQGDLALFAPWCSAKMASRNRSISIVNRLLQGFSEFLHSNFAFTSNNLWGTRVLHGIWLSIRVGAFV